MKSTLTEPSEVNMANRDRDYWLHRVARLSGWASLAYVQGAHAEEFNNAYGGDNRLLMEPLWIEHKSASGHILVDKKNGLVMSITGSDSKDDWNTNLRISLTSVGDLRVSATAWRHAKILARQFIMAALMPAGGNMLMVDRWLLSMGNNPHFTVIGHSLGGAVAILFPLAIKAVIREIRRGSTRIGTMSPEAASFELDGKTAFWRLLALNAEVITYGAWRPLTMDTAAYYPYRATHVEMVGDAGVLWPPAWMGYWHPGRLIVVDPNRHKLYARHSGVSTLFRQIWALIRQNGFSAHDSRTYVTAMSSWLDAPLAMEEDNEAGVAAEAIAATR